MLLDSTFTFKPVSVGEWFSTNETIPQQKTNGPDAIKNAHSRRLRRMLSQNFLQRAAHDAIQLFRGHRDVA